MLENAQNITRSNFSMELQGKTRELKFPVIKAHCNKLFKIITMTLQSIYNYVQ